MNKINVAVFFGGESLEKEISRITGAQVINALNKKKYNILPIYLDEQFNWWFVKDFNINTDLTICKKVKIGVFSGENVFNFKNLIKTKIKIHCAILTTHGGKGENGTLSAILDSLNIPFTSSNMLSSNLTINKHLTKLYLKEFNYDYLPYLTLNKKDYKTIINSHYFLKVNNLNNEKIKKSENNNSGLNKTTNIVKELDNFIFKIKYPLVVKPIDQGSSIGVSFVKNRKELEKALNLVFSISNNAIIEKGIKKVKEFNCSALKIDNKIMVSEIEKPIHRSQILTYEDKYGTNLGSKINTQSSKLSASKISNKNYSSSKGMLNSSREFPAKISSALKAKIQNLTKTFYELFECNGIIRCDFIYYNKKVYLNEINSIPGSLAFYLWLPSGYTFSTLLDDLIRATIRESNLKH